MQIHKKWVIDRHIPIALILAIVMQIAAALIWATQLDARVGGLEQEYIGNATLNEKFARLEERLDGVKIDTESMKHQLEWLTERLLKP